MDYVYGVDGLYQNWKPKQGPQRHQWPKNLNNPPLDTLANTPSRLAIWDAFTG